MKKCSVSFGGVLALSLVPALADQRVTDEVTDQVAITAPAVETTRFLAAPDGPVIYSNSLVPDPYQITHPGQGCGGGDACALQTALGLSSYGWGCQAQYGNTMADDFTIPSGETWTIEEIEFYHYQSGGTAPTITDDYWAIVDTNPCGTLPPPLTHSVPVVTWTNVYRPLDTGLTACTRGIQKCVVTVDPPIALAAGQYWLIWNAAGTGTSGPWQPPVTELGQVSKTTGPPNGMQSVLGGPFQYSGGPGCRYPAGDDFIFCLAGQGGSPPCPGDFDCDGDRDFDDIDPFVEALNIHHYCMCPHFASCDPNGDGKITSDDIDPFVALLGVPCP